MQDLSYLTRGQGPGLCPLQGKQSLNHWTTMEASQYVHS